MDESIKREELEKVREEILACQKCRLFETRIQAVPGSGNIETKVMFIGEAPGATEDQKGIPFCGAAGKFLDEMLEAAGFSRADIFITNTVKCRPPENRDPEDDEKAICRHYLEKQIELIKPRVIVCLGRHASASLLPGMDSISKIHGRALKRQNGIVYLPLYHPAAALHNGGLRSTLISDFMKLPAILEKMDEIEKSNPKEE
ncbi:MAG: uracil-DNA glycosylase [Candidatus Berkelbacteria bacterium]|nr:uracil-DNA glycosylase [Candidatus Berkelbacteria bacterium]